MCWLCDKYALNRLPPQEWQGAELYAEQLDGTWERIELKPDAAEEEDEA